MLLDWFNHHGHMCLVFEKMGLSVFDFMVRTCSSSSCKLLVWTVFLFSWSVKCGPKESRRWKVVTQRQEGQTFFFSLTLNTEEKTGRFAVCPSWTFISEFSDCRQFWHLCNSSPLYIFRRTTTMNHIPWNKSDIFHINLLLQSNVSYALAHFFIKVHSIL